ncbi:hypothetical protein BH20VER3_BH20VER3_02590 [soil metagenome]
MSGTEMAGQMNDRERKLLSRAVTEAPTSPRIVLEVGTWLGGGSTVHLLRALERNGEGHLWGIEADPSIYERMIANLQAAAPEVLHRFTPLFGSSNEVIPGWLGELGPEARVDLVFLDGGDNPMEQVEEFRLLDARIPVGGQLLSHDAKLRKGRWLVPYLSALDHWDTQLHDVSEEGLFHARKLRDAPSPESRRQAEERLRRLCANPVERLGAFLPPGVKAFLLRLLPRRLVARITQGRS